MLRSPPLSDTSPRSASPARPNVPAATSSALRERFDQLLNGRGDTPRQERGRASSIDKGDSRAKAEAKAEDTDAAGELAGAAGGLRSLHDAGVAAGLGDAGLALSGLGGAAQHVIAAPAEAAQAALRGGDPAMLQLAERIAALNLPPSGTWQVELPGADRIAARVERAAQGGGYAIALHLPAKAAEHRRRLAAELAMHLDARGVPRCIVRLADDAAEG